MNEDAKQELAVLFQVDFGALFVSFGQNNIMARERTFLSSHIVLSYFRNERRGVIKFDTKIMTNTESNI